MTAASVSAAIAAVRSAAAREASGGGTGTATAPAYRQPTRAATACGPPSMEIRTGAPAARRRSSAAATDLARTSSSR